MQRIERKPIIYLLVILPILLVGGIGIPSLLLRTYSRNHGILPSAVPDLNGFLIMLPAIFLWIPLTLLLANCVFFVVPPLRTIAEAYVVRAHRPGFLESQRQLGKLALLFAAFCVPLIVLGFTL